MGGLTPHYVRIAPGDPLPAVAQYAPFKAVFAIEAECANEWRNEVCAWLVASGCRYAMAWGHDCEQWHDAVDWAELKASNFEENDSTFILTTWHEKETLESAFWYAQFCANFSYDDVELNEAVIIDVSVADHRAEYLALWEQSKTLAEREG